VVCDEQIGWGQSEIMVMLVILLTGTAGAQSVQRQGFRPHYKSLIPAGVIMGIFLFATASRPALRLTHPPTQWVLWAISLGIKRSGLEADYSPPSSDKVKNVCGSIPPPSQYVSMT
jgi:hypothetical protein